MKNRIGDNLVHWAANEELVRVLSDKGVRFVVVGGLAVAWHCPEREADDMDLLVDPTHENSERISLVLTSLRLTGHGPDSFSRSGLQVPLKQIYYADLLTPMAGAASFAEIESAAVNAWLFSIPVRLASVSALIAMKNLAASSAQEERDKHLTDIASLERCACT